MNAQVQLCLIPLFLFHFYATDTHSDDFPSTYSIDISVFLYERLSGKKRNQKTTAVTTTTTTKNIQFLSLSLSLSIHFNARGISIRDAAG